MVNMLQAREIKQAAAAAGFDLCGICRVRNFSAEQTFFEGWLERGFDGGLGVSAQECGEAFLSGGTDARSTLGGGLRCLLQE